MKTRQRDSWMDTFSALGESLMQVLQAELEVLGEGWRKSARHMAVVLALVGAAVTFLVWVPPLLIAVIVSALHEAFDWPVWLAALVVAAGAVGIATLLMVAARLVVIKRVENPLKFLKTRVEDHLQWWRKSMLSETRLRGDSDEQPRIGNE